MTTFSDDTTFPFYPSGLEDEIGLTKMELFSVVAFHALLTKHNYESVGECSRNAVRAAKELIEELNRNETKITP